jgi:hypothetical protein
MTEVAVVIVMAVPFSMLAMLFQLLDKKRGKDRLSGSRYALNPKAAHVSS